MIQTTGKVFDKLALSMLVIFCGVLTPDAAPAQSATVEPAPAMADKQSSAASMSDCA